MSIARGPWRGPPAARPSSRSSSFTASSSSSGSSAGAHAQTGIQEARLVGQLADGVGVVHRGGCLHLHARGGQRIDRALQLGTAVA